MNRLLILVALLMALVAPAAAQPLAPGERAMRVTLLPESGTVAPGQRLALAFVMEPKPGWHGYWKNPGDAGTEARVEWRLPAGAEAGPLRYPVPDRLIIGGLMNYVFKGDYALLTELRIPEDAAPGSVLPVAARIDYLVCTDEICVPERAEAAVQLRVAREASFENKARFDGFRAVLPRPLDRSGSFVIENGRIRIAIPFPASATGAGAYFYPASEGALAYSAPQAIGRARDLLILETEAGPDAASLDSIEGVLKTGDGQGLAVTAELGAVPRPASYESEAAAGPVRAGSKTILLALVGAVLGGLLLNIMPCVFPILSLKALSLARAGGDERAARHEALAYTAGVILVCLALGGALLALRAGGAAYGWAFQLQDPRVILFLFLLVTAISLNLAGLFELPAVTGGDGLAAKGGTGGAFWTGALAAFVATPCTGPFMGAALGAALILPTAAALAIFAGLGLGLALPFLALGFIPALRRRLPKPGPWMGRFRRILAVPMFLTALALAWILGRQAGADGMALGLAAALLLGLALWWAGRRQDRQSRAWVPVAGAALGIFAALALLPGVARPAAAQEGGVLRAEPFNEARLAQLQQEERPVFVYFTADWCVTCKVNEKAVLERAEVAKAFSDKNITVLVGDWTRGDPAIGRFLESHGRSGVPLYLYYPPGGTVEILPQILTLQRVIALGGSVA
jgi:thiol:disulfide interchange protein